MKGGRWLVAIGALLIGGLLAIANTRHAFSPWTFTKSVDVKKAGQDHGYYYRFKASYTYKGEPFDFNIVVGCNVSVTTYKDNDRTVEVGVTPMVFGLKMKDGRGVVVHPPQACRGETTENGRVPASLLPLVVTYENADQPWSGLAYASDDAYDSPISELKFFGAAISRATFEEWQEWRRNEAPKNFVTYELLGLNAKDKFDVVQWKPGYRAMGSVCTGFSWVKLPESVREAMRPFWPASKPRYWYPNEEARSTFRSVGDFHLGKVLFEGNPLREYFGWPGDKGLPRHKPGAEIFYGGRVSGDVYPATSDISLNLLNEAGELPSEIKAKAKKSYADVIVDPKLRGFAYCDSVYNVAATPADISLNQLMTDRVNGEQISEDALRWHEWQFKYAFERDEYVFFFKRYPMVNAVFGGL
jgi:hypothetical protein